VRFAELLADQIAHTIGLSDEPQQGALVLETDDVDLVTKFVAIQAASGGDHNSIATSQLELMRHPRSVVTFSDAGAHVSQISDCSIPTYVLGHWVRDEQALTLEEAVRMLSFENASAFGLRGRGLVREGFAADLVVFDPERIAPQMPQIAHDLPGGARRLVQYAEGISATVVAGEVLLENGKHTGALPGRLLRRGSDAV